VPAVAAAAGYNQQTFGSEATLGKNWFHSNINNDPAKSGASQNSDGTIAISGLGGDNTYNAQIETVSAGATPDAWTGKAFGGGGYFEATMSFKNTPRTWEEVQGRGWPSFWAGCLESVLGLKPDLDNVEVDVVEFLSGPNSFGSGVIDWYGGNGEHVSKTGNPGAVLPEGTDFSQPHKYGFLWIPATDTKEGSAGWYFDGQQVGTTYTWKQHDPSMSGSDSAQQNPYSSLDVQHLLFIFGTGPDNPMTVQGMTAWQASDANNLTQ
jgi:hypothetical protein